MIVVIQCAGRKRPGAATLATRDGLPVRFVAAPSKAPSANRFTYARPDDLSDRGTTWREFLSDYNNQRRNTFGLFTAAQIYAHPVYEKLLRRFGPRCLFVLSAGWGLIAADFRVPAYDITFSAAEPYLRRLPGDVYHDYAMLPGNTSEAIIFLGGQSYVDLFCRLTGHLRCRRVVLHASHQAPVAPGCNTVRFAGPKMTNWHYDCAQAMVDGWMPKL